MHIRQMTRGFTIVTLTALAAMGAGCDTVNQLGSSKWDVDTNRPDLLSVHQLPGTPAANTTLPARDPKAVTIGAILPLTGTRALAGQAMLHGLQLAADQVNAAGGINGQPVKLAVLDSQSNLDVAEKAMETFWNYGETALLVGDGPLAVADSDKLAQIPTLIGFMCDYVAGPILTPNNGIRIYLNGDQEGHAIEDYVSASGVDRAAVVYENNLLGQSNKQYLLYLFTGNHGIFTTSEDYSAGETDFTLLGQAMMRVNSGALVLIGNGPEYSKILQSFEAAGWKGIVLGYAGVGGLATVAGQGKLAAEAAYPLPDFATDPRGTLAGSAFEDAYHTKFGANPDLPAAYAFDNIHAIADAAKQATSIDPVKIRTAFIAMQTYTGAVGRYEIKDDGDTDMPLRLWRQDGQALSQPTSKTQSAPTPADIKSLPTPGLTR